MTVVDINHASMEDFFIVILGRHKVHEGNVASQYVYSI